MFLLGGIKRRYFSSLREDLGYSRRDILVIVNIDDVGLHKDETEASFKAFRFGMVKSGSIMVPCPNYAEAVRLWRENPGIDLGIHLTVTAEWGKKYPYSSFGDFINNNDTFGNSEQVHFVKGQTFDNSGLRMSDLYRNEQACKKDALGMLEACMLRHDLEFNRLTLD